MASINLILAAQFYIFLSACPSGAEFRNAWNAGDRIQVLKDSVCLESDRDPENLRLRSDLLWWSGLYSESRKIAKLAEKNLRDQNDELGVHLYRRIKLFRLSLNYSGAILNNDRLNHEFGGRAAFNYWNANHLSFSYQRLLRSYPGQPQLDDNQYSVNHLLSFAPSIYLENEFQLTPSPQFSPKFSIIGSPHFVFSDSTDIGLTIRGNHYSKVNIWATALSVRRDFHFSVYGELRSDFLFKPKKALSGQILLGKNFNLFFLESKYAGGKTDEGDGILDHFHLGQIRGGYNISRWMKIIVDASVYRGGLRDEWKMGSGLEWYF